jgi:cytidylate kinase
MGLPVQYPLMIGKKEFIMAIVTISRGTHSGGKQLAELLAERLGYRCLSREELLTGVAKKYGASDDTLSAALHYRPDFLEGTKLGKIHYIAFVRAALCREVRYDEVVYHGQGGHLLLTGVPHILRVRVIADMEFRIKAAMNYHDVTRDKAIDLIKAVDHHRATWMVSIYQTDWQDASRCDLVIDLGHMSVDAACELLLHAARGPRLKTTPESQKNMEDLVLSSDIRERIAAHSWRVTEERIEDYEVKITSDEGVVDISGKTNSQQEVDRIIQIAGETPGVREVRSHMLIRTTGPIYELR